MNSKAYLSVVTFPLVTSAVLLAYACATQGPATEASLPVAQTVAIAKPVTARRAKGPLTLAMQQQPRKAAHDEVADAPSDDDVPAPTDLKDKTADRKASRKVTRYVAVESLNVRSKPQLDAEVVAKLARGSMLPVIIDGAWARLGDAQWIQVRYLTDRPHTKSKRRLLSKK
jgi:uncharacterized protein YgiM (DUF1202 family)